MDWYEKRHDYWNNCKHLHDDQRKALDDMLKITDTILTSVAEIYDLNLSDLKTLQDAGWAIHRAFPREEPSK